MTKVTILGQPQGDEPKKKIEFVKCIALHGAEKPCDPDQWDNIHLLMKNSREYDGLDVMWAFDDGGIEAMLYLGHFNDGIV